MRVIFFSKCLQFDADFKSGEKNRQYVVKFLDNCISFSSAKFQILKSEYLSSAVNIITKSQKTSNITNKRGFPGQFPLQWQNNFIKVLSWIFRNFSWPFNMLTVEGCYEVGYLDTSLTMPFAVCNFETT